MVSGDGDLVALVSDPGVKMLYPARDMATPQDLDEVSVAERFGVPPRLYPDFAMLRRDPSDGLPGVVGLGPVPEVRGP